MTILPSIALLPLLAPAQAQTPKRFDAASIKPHTSTDMRITMEVHPKRLTLTNLSLSTLIELAYGIREYQLTRPDWMDNASFDVAAETAEPLARNEMLSLLQPELAARFGLAIHRDSKTMAVYRLTVAKTGLKAKPADGETGLNISPAQSGGRQLSGKASMPNFASLLGSQTGRPGVDGTRLDGAYEFRLTYAPEPPVSDGAPQNAPSLFVASKNNWVCDSSP